VVYTPVPEASSLVLAAAGFAAVGCGRKKSIVR
jgi:hypothetical protein